MAYTAQNRQSLASEIGSLYSNKGPGLRRGVGLNLRWSARFRPPVGKTTKIRVVPGNYPGMDGKDHSFFQYVEVFCARTGRSFVSGATYTLDGGLNKISGDCLGWDILQREIAEGVPKDHRSVSVRQMNAMTVVHLADYHLVPAMDDNGNPKVYEKGPKKGEFIFNRVQCTGKGCEGCAGEYEKVFGNKMHWSLGQGHLVQLGGFFKSISQDCTNCGGSGTIDNPDDQEPHCSECEKASPLDPYECDISVKREGEGNKSAVQVSRWKKTDLTPELQEMAKPWDFSSIFFPDPVDVQARLLKVRVPQELADKAAKSYSDAWQK